MKTNNKNMFLSDRIVLSMTFRRCPQSRKLHLKDKSKNDRLID